MGVQEILGKPSIVFLVSLCLSITHSLTPVFAIHAKHSTHSKVVGPWGHQISKYRPEPTTAIANQHRVNTVSVACHSDFMEITIKADLFNVGSFVELEELHLGEDGDSCRLRQSSADEYHVSVAMTDCGTKHWVTEDSLTYTNHIVYTPVTSPDGLIRMNKAVIPIDCHYERKYYLASGSLAPKWIPFMSSKTATETLKFELKIMTNDWLYPRGSAVYFLGDQIHFEASLQIDQHDKLKIFVHSCVATLDPENDAVPKYVFIENGCLIDSQLPGSHSRFMPVTRDDRVLFQIDAFKFHNDDRGQIFITCQFAAVRVTEKAYHNEACTFMHGRWQSTDGSDLMCGHCPNQLVGKPHLSTLTPKSFGIFAPRSHNKPSAPESFRVHMKKARKGSQHETVGPLRVLPAKPRSVQFPHWEGSPAQVKVGRQIASGSQWQKRVDYKHELEREDIQSSLLNGTFLGSLLMSTSDPTNLTTDLASWTTDAVEQNQEKEEFEAPIQALNATLFSINDTTDMLLQKDNSRPAMYLGNDQITPSVGKNLDATTLLPTITVLESDSGQDG